MKNLNKKILIATDGSAGMISQVKGLALEISDSINSYTTKLLFPWSRIQPGFLPVYKWIFLNEMNFVNPDILITCGRKSVFFSLFMKKKYKDKILTIHIQNPKVESSKFDYVIIPNHDNFKGKNIINSVGAIHHFSKKTIDEYEDKIKLPYSSNIISVIIGGKNQHYHFSDKIIDDLILKIKNLRKKYDKWNFIVVGSRRTGINNLKIFQKKLQDVAHVWVDKDKNPYLSILKKSDLFIVTSDSTSMISECSATGKPVYIYHLPFKRISNRIVNFHKEFENMNITRKLDDNLEVWSYKILNESKRIAGILKTRILNNNNNNES